MTRVLITGGAGFIGRHLHKQLLDEGYEVQVLDPRSGTGSILDVMTVRQAMKDVDLVFHLAALAHLWAADHRDYERVNVEGTRVVLAEARRAGVKRIIVTQTEVILRGYDISTGRPLCEDEPAALVSEMAGPYSVSKWQADRLCRETNDLDIVSLYPTVPVGAGDDAMTAPTAMLEMFLNAPPPAYLPATLNYVPVEDVARAHILAAQKADAGARFLIAGEDWTMERIFDLVASYSDKAMPARRIPYVLARISASISERLAGITKNAPLATVEGVRFAKNTWLMDASHAREVLGWEAGDVSDALNDALSWLQHRQ